MSGAQLLEFGSEPRFGNLSFPDLEARFGTHLEQVRSVTDLDSLIRSIKPFFQDEHYSPDELVRLKRLRQRAYDLRRNPKFQMPISVPDLGSKPQIQIARLPDPISLQIPDEKSVPTNLLAEAGASMITHTSEKTALPQPRVENFVDGVWRALSSIDGERFVKTAPKLLAWLIAASLVSFFLWQQSLALYETAGFTNAIYSATGGILMIVGFAAYHSITRSWLALFFCIYAGAYEGYLMVSGTINDEGHTQTSEVQNNPELVFLAEKASKERDRYHELKQRYDNPESKVFKNEWFLKNHLNPAWDVSLRAHEELLAKKAALMTIASAAHVTWLKIFYRLGLVFLCMMLVHRFFASCVQNKPACSSALNT